MGLDLCDQVELDRRSTVSQLFSSKVGSILARMGKFDSGIEEKLEERSEEV